MEDEIGKSSSSVRDSTVPCVDKNAVADSEKSGEGKSADYDTMMADFFEQHHSTTSGLPDSDGSSSMEERIAEIRQSAFSSIFPVLKELNTKGGEKILREIVQELQVSTQCLNNETTKFKLEQKLIVVDPASVLQLSVEVKLPNRKEFTRFRVSDYDESKGKHLLSVMDPDTTVVNKAWWIDLNEVPQFDIKWSDQTRRRVEKQAKSERNQAAYCSVLKAFCLENAAVSEKRSSILYNLLKYLKLEVAIHGTNLQLIRNDPMIKSLWEYAEGKKNTMHESDKDTNEETKLGD